ncbi:MAG: hypothetical protein GX579_16030 [Chloroflexi bacterium]|nr:hypothetical protein [Chloroflexota bacterium]
MPRNPARRRCTALSLNGRPCRRWARRGTDRCPGHEAPPRPRRPRPKQRCTALTRAGTRCRRWATQPPADPAAPTCALHAPHTLPPHATRCRAFTHAGKRCRRWATLASRRAGRPRCSGHDGHHHPPSAAARRCTALTRAGHSCRNLAIRDSDPPRCASHRSPSWRMPGPADAAAGRTCTATTLDGQPCRCWAIRHTRPPRCFVHAYPAAHGSIRHSYYRRTPFLPAAFQATLDRLVAQGRPLDAEIILARFKLVALLAYLNRRDLSPAETLPAYRLTLRTLRAVARLLRTRHALDSQSPSPTPLSP